jgi:hypothetical protein
VEGERVQTAGVHFMKMNCMNYNEIDKWPNSWKYCSKDIESGKKLIKLMKPFIEELSNTYSSRTAKMHRDNLWLLGGYVIKHMNKYEKDRNIETCLLLTKFIDSWDGPMVPGLSEKEQSSFDNTCRKFYKHLVNNVLKKLIS